MKFKVKSCMELFNTYMVPNEEGGAKREMAYGYYCVLEKQGNDHGIFEIEDIKITLAEPLLVGQIVKVNIYL